MPEPVKGITRYWTVSLQEWIVSICCITMIAGMLFSRAILSMSMILLFINALHPDKLLQTWNIFKRSRFALFCILFFLSYVISGLWSEDTMNWADFIKIKLPFIFLPFPLLNTPFSDQRFRRVTTGGILVVLLAGMLYSFYPLLQDPYYLKAHPHLPSPLEGDYIRFTIVLVFGIQFVFWFLLTQRRRVGKAELILTLLWVLIAVVYIHVQAAKSGLLCFYLLLVVFLFYLLQGRQKWLPVAAMFGMMAIALLAVLFTPALNKQLRNMLYERKVWESENVSEFGKTSSFVPRLVSYRIAGDLLYHYPWLGVGAGDIKLQMDMIYTQKYPSIPVEARLIPHNQFICTALAVGFPLSGLLIIMVITPLWHQRRNIFMISTFLVMLLGLLIEPMLETQYGIFVYLFFTLFWMEIPYRTIRKKSVPALA